LDLSDFVLDVGSHRWMFLSDSKFSTVSDLVEQLKAEYMQLEEGDLVQVFMDGNFVIPPWESIEILQSGDLLRVVKTVSKDNVTINKPVTANKVPPSLDTRDGTVVMGTPNMGKKTKNIRVENISSNRKRKVEEQQKLKSSKKPKVVAKQSSSSSGSSSSSDTAQDITSKMPVIPHSKNSGIPQEKRSCVDNKVSKTPILKNQEDSDSSSTDSSDSESSDEPKQIVKKPTVPTSSASKPVKVTKPSSSSGSDSESSSETSEDEKKPTAKPSQNVIKKIDGIGETMPCKIANTSNENKPKRKRRRKNKNKNKLSADQIPVFGAQIVPTPAAIKQTTHTLPSSNNHVRFDNNHGVNTENGEVEEVAGGEEFSAEDIRQLYSQSVPSNGIPGTPTQELQNEGNIGGEKKGNYKEGSNYNKHNSFNGTKTPDTSVSCEDVLMKQFEDSKVSNNAVVNKPSPKIVFTPRALSLKEMKKDIPKNRNLKFSQSQEVDLSQFSTLLNCKDSVFDKNSESTVVAPVETKDYSAYHAVSGSGPRVGDIIAFKVIEMGENYTPEVSDFKEGKVLECEGTNTVTFELLKVSKKKKNGKFEIEEEEQEEEKVVTFNWAELIDPRLMFP